MEIENSFIASVKREKTMTLQRRWAKLFQRIKKNNQDMIEQYMAAIQQYIAKNYKKQVPPQYAPYKDTDQPVPHFDSDHGTGFRYSLKDYRDTEKLEEGEKGAADPVEFTSLEWFLDQVKNHTFVNKLSALIRQKGMRDPAVYKAANMDRRLFSKIMSDYGYQPSKDTVIALSFALRLSFDEAKDLLDAAGYTLSRSIRRDVAIEYFFRSHIYSLTDINIVLDRLGLKIIGRQNVV